MILILIKRIAFDEVLSPVMKMLSICVVLGLAAGLNLEIVHMDVKLFFSMVTWMKKII